MKIKKHIFPLLVALMTIATRSFNLFGYPYFENDEGVYTSQAWWLADKGEIAPYTYWYDHAPFGWLTIGLWQKITGGPLSFGFSLFSTRIFMVIVAVLTNLLVYKIIELVSNSRKTALFSSLLLVFSPLAVTYQRRVLLDNLETLWLLLSVWFLLRSRSDIKKIFLSALFFGLAFLSKEAVIFLYPVMIYGLFILSKKENKRFSLLIFLVTSVFLISIFPLIALLKGEFFPSSWFNTGEHVSFLETIKYQLSRGTGLKPWNPQSMTYNQVIQWFNKGPILLGLGIWSLLYILFFEWKNKKKRIILLLAFLYMLFLLRGGLVLEFYILPLLALLSISIGVAVNAFKKIQLFRFWLIQVIGILAISLIMIFQETDVYTSKPTKAQLQAAEYVKTNLKKDGFLVIDNFCFLDLRLAGFQDAEWFWKVEEDHAIREKELKNNWQNIDYILLSGEMRRKIVNNELPFIKEALASAELIKDFPSKHPDEQGEITDLSRRGDGWAALFKVQDPREAKKIAKTEKMKKIIANMSLEQKVGKLFVVGLEKQGWNNELKELIEKYHFNAFFVKSKNFSDQEELKELITNIKLTACNLQEDPEPDKDTKKNTQTTSSCVFEPLIFVDQEGGSVSTLEFENVENKPQAEIKKSTEAYKIAKNRGQNLKNLGINANFAPVAEKVNSKLAYINREGRAFQGDNENVYILSEAMIRGYKEAGVLPVVKHFPGGLGNTIQDPHQEMPVLQNNKNELKNDLYVFQKLIENKKVDAIMTTHLKYAQIDAQNPVTTSDNFISGILRGELGYEGLIISDDLVMNSITNKFTISEAATKAILAGHDLVLISGYKNDQINTYQTILKSVKNGQIKEDRVDESLERFLRK